MAGNRVQKRHEDPSFCVARTRYDLWNRSLANCAGGTKYPHPGRNADACANADTDAGAAADDLAYADDDSDGNAHTPVFDADTTNLVTAWTMCAVGSRR